jgi:hypothetical protein
MSIPQPPKPSILPKIVGRGDPVMSMPPFGSRAAIRGWEEPVLIDTHPRPYENREGRISSIRPFPRNSSVQQMLNTCAGVKPPPRRRETCLTYQPQPPAS